MAEESLEHNARHEFTSTRETTLGLASSVSVSATTASMGMAIVDWFVPDDAKTDPERRRRSNLTAIAALGLGWLAIPLLLLNYQMVGYLGPTVIAFIVSTGVLSLLALLLRAGVPQQWVGALITFDLLLALTCMTYFNGGVRAASIIWLIPVPLVGQVLVGRAFGLVCAALTVLELTVFYVLHLQSVPFFVELSPEQMLLWHVVGGCSSLVFVAGIGFYFEQERHRAERATRESDERLRMVVADADVMLLALDAEGVIQLAVGKRLGAMNGELATLEERTIFDIFPADQSSYFREALAGATVTFESTLHGCFLETSIAPAFDETGAQVGVTCLSIDVTRRKKLEESVELSNRMASIGVLAAGVGHEINNPLTYILGSVEIALEQIEAGGELDVEDLASSLRDAKGGAERVRDIVSDLRLFARPDSGAETHFFVEEAIVRATMMASHEISHRAKLITDFAKTPQVVGIEGQFGQVMLNLLVNAAQSIPPGAYDDNEISVRTACRGTTSVVIEVRDTGQGLEAEAKARLFEPFFTTKSATGSGLGLSISHRIVESMGGTFEVECPTSGGTLFRVVLPAAQSDSTPPIADVSEAATSRPKSACILIVDDQVAVLRSLKRMLTPQHSVVTTTSGREALKLLETQSFDLVLCDLMMPEMTGIDVYEELVARDSQAAQRMTFMTGGVFTENAREFLGERSEALLTKPFNVTEVRAFVNRHLDSPV